jgi:hypothetical protein
MDEKLLTLTHAPFFASFIQKKTPLFTSFDSNFYQNALFF